MNDGTPLYSPRHPRPSFWKWLKQFPWRRPKLSQEVFSLIDYNYNMYRENLGLGSRKMFMGMDIAHPDGDSTVEWYLLKKETGCYVANDMLVCYCGKCKQKDYPLPKDL